MNKLDYIKYVKKNLKKNASKIVIEQINNYYDVMNYLIPKHNYQVGDDVYLKKGTLLHGTYKNIEGLKNITNEGLISSWFVGGHYSKYPGCVGVWNLKKDYLLKDYVNFYSGGTIMYMGLANNDEYDENKNVTTVIPYDELNNILEISRKHDCHKWLIEQTKEARFMPSLVQDKVQIGIIIDGNNSEIKKLIDKDILNPDLLSDKVMKDFVNPYYYKKFIKERKNKDDFFTDRESAIIFGIPANFIEGILVGRDYEKNNKILTEIKELLPNVYVCNLDGKVIVV